MFATYTQTATKLGKRDDGAIVYSLMPTNQRENEPTIDDIYAGIEQFVKDYNKAMTGGRDRLHVELKTVRTDAGDFVLSAQFVPNEYAKPENSAVIGKVSFD